MKVAKTLAQTPPWLAAMLAVGLTVGGLLIGRSPIGGDPDLMYRPIKAELARNLRSGTLPFWSDRFGLGVPLVAESHIAAFYPPNWLLYGLLDVATAYRLAMWGHYAALAAATYAYARRLGITPWGSALSALAFSLCGFQAIHGVHEPFYLALPFVPLCLLLADRYATSGRVGWLAGLAIAWACQLFLGHFQLPMWTGGLVLVMGPWRVISGGHRLWRAPAIAAALAWGGAIAAVQLGLTKEMSAISGFGRSFGQLSIFVFPPSHWAQPALPELFLGLKGGPNDPYWGEQLTTAGEASFYIGTVPLILAIVGWIGVKRDRPLAPWKLVVIASWFLASLPTLWPDLYMAITLIPGLGLFRAPARYTVLTSLGLALLAGRGFDRSIVDRRFRAGWIAAVIFGLGAFAWAFSRVRMTGLGASLGVETLPWRFGAAGLAWGLGLVAIGAWRKGKVGPWAPFVVTALELAMLYGVAPSEWGWWVPLPERSPVLKRLAREPDVGLVMGGLGDIPAGAGLATAYPYLGITPPPPNYLLAHADKPLATDTPEDDRWRRRFGVTHSVRRAGDPIAGRTVLFTGHDPVLDRLMRIGDGATRTEDWTVLTYPSHFSAARLATRATVTEEAGEIGWAELYGQLSREDSLGHAWYIRGDEPPPPTGPRAQRARVVSYDGRTAVVEHDGGCDLIVRRTYYPGWLARIDDGPERPVHRVDGGLQAVRIEGTGTSRVVLAYRPTGLARWRAVSAVAAVSALVVAGWAMARGRLTSPPRTPGTSAPGR